MRQVSVLVAVGLRRSLRDRTSLFFIFVFPLMIIVLIGSLFGGGPTAVDVGVLDEDRTDLSAAVGETIDRTPAVSVRTYHDIDRLRRDVRTGRVDAGVIIPEGTAQTVETGGEVALPLLADLTRNSTPAVRAAISGALDGRGSVLSAAHFAAARSGAPYDEARAEADRLAGSFPGSMVGRETVDTGGSVLSDNRFAYTTAANLILFTFINSLATSAEIVEARRLGITRRILAAPVTPTAVLVGIGAGRVTFALLQAAIVVTMGAALFGVGWGNPLALAVVVLVWAVLSSGAGLLIGSLGRDSEQVQALGVPIGIGLAMLGGCMWPLEIVPDVVRAVGHVFPHAWAMDAMIDVVLDREGIGAVLPEVGVLLVFAAALVASGTWFTRRAVTGSAAPA